MAVAPYKGLGELLFIASLPCRRGGTQTEPPDQCRKLQGELEIDSIGFEEESGVLYLVEVKSQYGMPHPVPGLDIPIVIVIIIIIISSSSSCCCFVISIIVIIIIITMVRNAAKCNLVYVLLLRMVGAGPLRVCDT
jgi:hypothetical protein